MRITAIAREDLSNIGNGLVPNKITLELSGKIVPDSYGEHIGRYDVEKEVYESFFKKIMKQEIRCISMHIKSAIALEKRDMRFIRKPASKR